MAAERPKSSTLRLAATLTASACVVTAAAIATLPLALVTAFRARRLYSAVARTASRAVLRIWGVRIAVHRAAPWPRGQTVYVSNHSSTVDLFVLMALGLPNTRFFLSRFVQKYVPIGVFARLMGTFFTVPQSFRDERVRIFQRACRILRRTGESVYASPEGERVLGGRIGAFNRGAFHLAIELGAPIAPFVIFVPPEIDPEIGFDARPGTVHVYVKPLIDTSAWRVEEVDRRKEEVRDAFVAWRREIGEEHHVRSSEDEPARRAALAG